MSGIEVAGLAFGVLPILVEAVKSYKDVSKKIHTLRHHSKAVKSVSEQLKVHSGIFLNEIRLLLRCVETEEEVEAMLNDAADQRWISTHLNEKLRKVLQDSFEICHGEKGDVKVRQAAQPEEQGRWPVPSGPVRFAPSPLPLLTNTRANLSKLLSNAWAARFEYRSINRATLNA
jgi:hypothetical protein